jgi:hypothetical protein
MRDERKSKRFLIFKLHTPVKRSVKRTVPSLVRRQEMREPLPLMSHWKRFHNTFYAFDPGAIIQRLLKASAIHRTALNRRSLEEAVMAYGDYLFEHRAAKPAQEVREEAAIETDNHTTKYHPSPDLGRERVSTKQLVGCTS